MFSGDEFCRAKVISLTPPKIFLIDEGIILESAGVDLFPFPGKVSEIFARPFVHKMKLPECTLVCKMHFQKPKDQKERYSTEDEFAFEEILKSSKDFILRPKGVHEVIYCFWTSAIC